MIEWKKLYYIITLFSYTVTIFLGISYIYNDSIVTLLLTLVMLIVSSTLYCFNNIKYYIIHLIFYITIFLFLVSRPTIDYFKHGLINTYQEDAYRFSFLAVIISIIGLNIGGLLVSKKEKNKKQVDEIKKSSSFINSIRKVSLVVFFISYPFYLVRLVERLMYRINVSYYEYYAEFKSELPYFTYTLSTFVVYAMCIYLATKPSKRNSTIVLGLFVTANVINLLIGTRNPFVLSLIFSFIYYFMRNQTEKGVWIGVKEKVVLYIGTPIMMLVMGFLNYARDGEGIGNMSLSELLIDFIYKQGTSFGVLARGYLYGSNLPIREFRNYTFSPIIEYITRGNLGILFGGTPFVSANNSIELALESDRYAHNISYIVLGQDYLAGHGIGGSYVMEMYTDYGMIGLFLLSIIMGISFIFMMKSSYKPGILLFSITLLILNNLFFMPRGSFTESFYNLVTLQFWGIVIVIFFLAGLIKRRVKYVVDYKGDV
ncbi:O-antigen polysaccharide polymerase Wzy family protein [Streptococcus chosunensis]|uniref:O-antigen polysaccharide polymerase Wzy family protein n=1 Tax=Streptococcus chosunensis TaxID=2707003 RepID=UPI001396698D|nr:O-antigen polysaccharide polymerase Wzy family protein [Streptococcus chosunense]